MHASAVAGRAGRGAVALLAILLGQAGARAQPYPPAAPLPPVVPAADPSIPSVPPQYTPAAATPGVGLPPGPGSALPPGVPPVGDPVGNLGSIVNQMPGSGPAGGNLTSSGTGGLGGTNTAGGSTPRWYEVGSDLNFRAFWDNGLIFETANKDWRVHVGGRFQYEPVWWAQPDKLRPPGPVGVGTLQDGSFFRRVRLRSDGVGYDTVEYALEVDFEQLNFVTYDHLWFGMKNLPFLGTVRIGQMKTPQGMDNIGSDYHLTFLERDVLSEGIWAALFSQGIQVSNTFFNDNVTFQTMVSRLQPVVQFFTSTYGSSNYASTSRLTWTPLYQDQGANLVHVGGSYQFRNSNIGSTIQPGGTGNDFLDTQGVVRFRARPELRDAVGVGSIGNGLLGGNPTRFVDTGYMMADRVHTISPEFLWVGGRFSVQSEAAWAIVENARTFNSTTSAITPRGTATFWGWYAEGSCFLTGEHRGYDRRFGTFDRPKVAENAFLVKGDDGRYHWGWGAWQVAYRFSFLDLNSNGINGGQLLQQTFGVNWYLNDNTKIQFQYSNIERNVVAPNVSGTVHGFGMLGQWYF